VVQSPPQSTLAGTSVSDSGPFSTQKFTITFRMAVSPPCQAEVHEARSVSEVESLQLRGMMLSTLLLECVIHVRRSLRWCGVREGHFVMNTAKLISNTSNGTC